MIHSITFFSMPVYPSLRPKTLYSRKVLRPKTSLCEYALDLTQTCLQRELLVRRGRPKAWGNGRNCSRPRPMKTLGEVRASEVRRAALARVSPGPNFWTKVQKMRLGLPVRLAAVIVLMTST